MSTCCKLHEYLLQVTWVLVASGMSTCCKWHEYLLKRTWVLVASDMSTCCKWHEYLLQVTWVFVASNMSTCCHVCDVWLLAIRLISMSIVVGDSCDRTVSLVRVRRNRCLRERLESRQLMLGVAGGDDCNSAGESITQCGPVAAGWVHQVGSWWYLVPRVSLDRGCCSDHS